MSRGHYHCPLRQPMRLNILAACRFHQFPNQRRFRAIRGQGFTLGSVLGSAQLSPKDRKDPAVSTRKWHGVLHRVKEELNGTVEQTARLSPS
jgi:hypothetical protein